MQEELLYEMNLKMSPAVNIGPVPEGARIDLPFTGEVSGPSIHGRLMV